MSTKGLGVSAGGGGCNGGVVLAVTGAFKRKEHLHPCRAPRLCKDFYAALLATKTKRHQYAWTMPVGWP